MTLRRYERLLALGSGGMATVFVARACGGHAAHRLVAVKRPHALTLASPELRDAFVREAAIGGAIHHANAVAVHDFVLEDEIPHVVMDYVDGPSLAQLRRAARERGLAFPISVALRIVLDACAGLHAAHEAVGADGRGLGVIHRDVCPENVLVGRDGVARVSDFGVAKCVSDATTEPGYVKGRLAFMAPEYLLGQPIDRRVDVFAVGIIAWELLSGRALVARAPAGEIVATILSETAPPPSTLRSEIPPAIDDVVLAALAKTPEARFATADAFAEALERAAMRARVYPSDREVATFVEECCGPMLARRGDDIRSALARAA